MPLIFDIGMNNGDDTAYYLGRGHRVVAVEANPVLAERGKTRFADEITAGALTIVNEGVGEQPGRATFWVSRANSEWSSFLHHIATRNGTTADPIEVGVRTFRSLIDEFGCPHYAKIDIEGHDIFCLRELANGARPELISVEAHRLEYLALLYAAGYRGFKVVNQREHGRAFPYGSSGPFGDELRGEWEPLETVAYDWLHMRLGRPARSSLGDGWYDFHATLAGPDLVNGVAKRPLNFRGVRRVRHIAARIAARFGLR